MPRQVVDFPTPPLGEAKAMMVGGVVLMDCMLLGSTYLVQPVSFFDGHSGVGCVTFVSIQMEKYRNAQMRK